METKRTLAELAQMLEKVAGDIRSLADCVRAVCTAEEDGQPESVKEAPEPPVEAPAIPLEKVRGVLADKSRGGKTAGVRAIIKRYGADRLSGIDPKDYAAVLRDAEVL